MSFFSGTDELTVKESVKTVGFRRPFRGLPPAFFITVINLVLILACKILILIGVQSEAQLFIFPAIWNGYEGSGDLEEGHEVGLGRRLELRLQPAGELLGLDLGVLEVEGVGNNGERNTSSAGWDRHEISSSGLRGFQNDTALLRLICDTPAGYITEFHAAIYRLNAYITHTEFSSILHFINSNLDLNAIVCCMYVINTFYSLQASFNVRVIFYSLCNPHQKILDQALDILGCLGGRRIVGRQLDQRGQEVLTLLHVVLHFLWGTYGEHTGL